MARTDHEQLALGLTFIQVAGHEQGWRLSTRDSDKERLSYYIDVARLADDALFHFLFLGDNLSGATNITPGWTPSPEPLSLTAVLSSHTRQLGFAPSASTIYSDPFSLARQLATLDHISEGRAGWNILTSYYADSASRNYTAGRAIPYTDRYRASQEFLDVMRKLWRAWDEDAVIRDSAAGWYARVDSVHPVRHKGEFFEIEGALNVTRSPQVEPVALVPVATPGGIEFAAHNAELVFTNRNTLDEAQTFAATLKRHAADAGRDRRALRVTPGVVVVIGDTDKDAWDQVNLLRPFIDREQANDKLAQIFGWNGYPEDAADDLPREQWPEVRDTPRARELLAGAARREATLGDLAYEVASSRNFALFVGTADTVAADLEEWFEAGAADGFMVGPLVAPDGVERIAKELVPALQRRGSFRTETQPGATLRQSLNLPPLPE